MSTPPDREAPAEAPIEALFRRRWSPRSFTDQPVSDAHMASLLEAARAAERQGKEALCLEQLKAAAAIPGPPSAH